MSCVDKYGRGSARPVLSVIVPIYGVEKYLRQCVDSILAQTWSDFEILLIDDGSKDACPAICEEYAAKDDRVRVIHKRNAGYGAAVNDGLRSAKGEFIGIVEPDDWIEPWMYERLIEKGIALVADVVKCGFSYVFGERESQEVVWPEGLADKAFKVGDVPDLLRWHPSIWSCIYRRKFLVDNGILMMETSGASWVDNPFQVQTLCLANRLACVDGVGYKYRVFPGKLKDWRLPFVRSQEIHDWLEKKGLDDVRLMFALARRELVYLKIAAEVVPWQHPLEVARAARRMVSRWPRVSTVKVMCVGGGVLKEYAWWRHFPCLRMMAVTNRWIRGALKVLGVL